MEDNVSGHFNSWEGGQQFYGFGDFVALISSYLGLAGFSVIIIFCCQRRRLGLLFCCGSGQPRGFQNIQSFLLALLTMDVIHIILTVIYVINLAMDGSNYYPVYWINGFHVLWILSRYFMVVLHLITALATIYYMYDPPPEGRARCIAPVIYFFTIFVLIVQFSVIYIFITTLIGISLGLLNFGLVVAIASKNRFSGDFYLNTAVRKPIVLVSIISFTISFCPSFIYHCLVLTGEVYVTPSYMYFQCCTNIQLLLDALLRFFILKVPKEQEPRPQRRANVPTVSQRQMDLEPPAYDDIEFESSNNNQRPINYP